MLKNEMNSWAVGCAILVCCTILLPISAVTAQLSGGSAGGTAPEVVDAPLGLAHVGDVVAHLNAHEHTAPVMRRLEVILSDRAAAAAVPGILLRGEADDQTASILIHTLGVVGTRQAQQSLGEIYTNHEQVHMNRVRAVVSTGSLEEPVHETVGSLWGMVGQRFDPVSIDLSNTATLGLGRLGSRLREEGEPKQKQFAKIRTGLRDSLHAAGDSMERSALLKAIGNLADVSLEPDVVPYLTDEFAPVRASTAQALAMIGAHEARRPLVDQLKVEPRGVVRGEIVRALVMLETSEHALDTVHAMILGEGHPEARFMMTAYLLEHLDNYPAGRATLKHVFENDDSKRIRILASRVLSP